MRIAIVGYGTAGQAAAIFLARDGHSVEMFERSSELRPVGAGFLLQPTGLGVLTALGLRDAAIAHGARIEQLHGANATGRSVMHMRYTDHAPESFGLGMTRGALFSLLHAQCASAASIRTGVRFRATTDDGRGLVDEAGTEFGRYDLVIAADGTNSTLRAESGLAQRDPFYPWGAIWCLLPAEDWPYAVELRQRYDGTRTMLGVLPVGLRAGADDARRWLTFYYSLPGPRVDTFDAQALAQLQHDVAALWPELAERTRALTDPAQLHRARYRDVVLRKPWRGRLVFIGDAAHGMSPQLGQGVNMALLDAQALADALRENADVERALAQYAGAREPCGGVSIAEPLADATVPVRSCDARSNPRRRLWSVRPPSVRAARDAEDPDRHEEELVAISESDARVLRTVLINSRCAKTQTNGGRISAMRFSA